MNPLQEESWELTVGFSWSLLYAPFSIAGFDLNPLAI